VYILKEDAGVSGLGVFRSHVLIQRSSNKDTQLGTQLELSVGTNILLQIDPALNSMQFVSMVVQSLIIHRRPQLYSSKPSPHHLRDLTISYVHFFDISFG
jgi:hypothetical protein